MIKKYNFEIEQILEMVSLYQLGVPTPTIAGLYGINKVTLWILLKKDEKIDLFKFRSRSETVLKNLSRKKTNPPGEFTNQVKKWNQEFGREGLIDILTVFLLTEASADYEYGMIRMTNSDTTLLRIFTDLLSELNLVPRETKDIRNGLHIIFARNLRVKKILTEIYRRTPTTKHQPQRGTENWRDYLKTKQPSLSFLYGGPKPLIELCFRIGMSTDGCVMASKHRNRAVRPALHLTCFHPLLILEWKRLSDLIGLNFNLNDKKIRTRSVDSIEAFLKMGGFLEGIKISPKSKYYSGLEKNKRLKELLENYYKTK